MCVKFQKVTHFSYCFWIFQVHFRFSVWCYSKKDSIPESQKIVQKWYEVSVQWPNSIEIASLFWERLKESIKPTIKKGQWEFINAMMKSIFRRMIMMPIQVFKKKTVAGSFLMLITRVLLRKHSYKLQTLLVFIPFRSIFNLRWGFGLMGIMERGSGRGGGEYFLVMPTP